MRTVYAGKFFLAMAQRPHRKQVAGRGMAITLPVNFTVQAPLRQTVCRPPGIARFAESTLRVLNALHPCSFYDKHRNQRQGKNQQGHGDQQDPQLVYHPPCRALAGRWNGAVNEYDHSGAHQGAARIDIQL